MIWCMLPGCMRASTWQFIGHRGDKGNEQVKEFSTCAPHMLRYAKALLDFGAYLDGFREIVQNEPGEIRPKASAATGGWEETW